MVKSTIIIPTYNRPEYLKWLLDYYHKYGNDFDIVVADSSSAENKKLNRKIVLSFLDLNIQYIDKYPEEVDPYHKFADMVNYAKEKYCVFCADDDFVVPNGINQAVDFLEKNPDFTVTYGYYMGFLLKIKKQPRGGSEKQFHWQTYYPKKSITFPKPEDRLFKHLSEYSGMLFYGVYRTDFLKIIYGELLNSKVDTVLFGEMLPGMLALIYGKTKCLDVFYMGRRLSSHIRCWPTLIDFKNQGRYDAEYVKFRQCLATHLSKKSQSSIGESKKIIDDAMSKYIKFSFNPFKRILEYNADRNRTFNKLYKGVRSIYRGARFIYRLVAGGNLNPLNSKYNFLPEYCDDFEKIKNQVIKSDII